MVRDEEKIIPQDKNALFISRDNRRISVRGVQKMVEKKLKLAGLDAVAFGCPAMGSEALEDSEFEPLFEEIKTKLAGKKVGLFGSYGWGDGEWMRTWEDDCAGAGISLAAESVICNDAPDDEALEACRALGETLAK